jgi:hypothetical protein
MHVTVPADCASVKDEIDARAAGANGWFDQHNRGSYTIVSQTSAFVDARRLTGNKKYSGNRERGWAKHALAVVT